HHSCGALDVRVASVLLDGICGWQHTPTSDVLLLRSSSRGVVGTREWRERVAAIVGAVARTYMGSNRYMVQPARRLVGGVWTADLPASESYLRWWGRVAGSR